MVLSKGYFFGESKFMYGMFITNSCFSLTSKGSLQLLSNGAVFVNETMQREGSDIIVPYHVCYVFEGRLDLQYEDRGTREFCALHIKHIK